MLTLACDTSSNPVDDLVSALECALNTVKSTRWSTRTEDVEEEGKARRLVAEFDALAGIQRDQVAHALTQLWDAFNERFHGVQGFLSGEFADRHAYVKQLERAGERMAPYRDGAAAHYYLATALMLTYVKAVLQQQSLGSRVIEAVQRARVLAREGPNAHSRQTIKDVPLLAAPRPDSYPNCEQSNHQLAVHDGESVDLTMH
jgi:hypothetical protein